MSAMKRVLAEIEDAIGEVGSRQPDVTSCLRTHGAVVAAEYAEGMPPSAWETLLDGLLGPAPDPNRKAA